MIFPPAGETGKNMIKKDKRARKTVRSIQDTLLRMLCRTQMRKIHIVDLCTEADINRTTFYLHFRGLEDVLASLRQEIVENIFERGTDDVIDFDMPRNPLPFLTICTDVLASYEGLGEFVRLSADADMFLTQLKNEFASHIFSRYTQARGAIGGDALCVFRFLTAGVLDCYTEWLKSDRRVPFEEVLGTCAPIVSAGQKVLARTAR